MTGLFDPVEFTYREGASIEISRKLIEYLLSGRAQPGQRLPPERKLAEALGVGRSVIREALKALTLLGLLESRLGDGTYVKEASDEVLPQSIEWGLVVGARNILDLLEARRELEPILADLAAERRDDQAVVGLRGLVVAMKAARDDSERFAAAEEEFLDRVATAANNDVLGGGLRTMRSLLRAWVARLPADRQFADTSIASYVEVVDAIERSDREAARGVMYAQMDRIVARGRMALDSERVQRTDS